MNSEVHVFVPGRLCIIGEHSDWAAIYRNENRNISKGYALTAGVDLGIYLNGSRDTDFIYEFMDKKIHLSMEEVENYNEKNFFEYVVTSAAIIRKRFRTGGAYIHCVKMTLPIQKGLASSAAICVGIIRVFGMLYDLKLTIKEEMEIAYEAETLVGARCGKLDQVCAYGHGLRTICFDGNNMEIIPAKSKEDLYFVLVDLGGKKDTKKILNDLNSVFHKSIYEKDNKLIIFLGDFNQRSVENATRALLNGELKKFAAVLNDYQENFDKNVACFSDELKAPLLHEIMCFFKKNPNVLACKGVGSQGDGMAQILTDSKESADRVVSEIEKYFHMKCYEVKVPTEKLNAIIPIAGKGTRMYPFTRTVDKAFLPLIDAGKVYPALFLIMKELFFSNCVGQVELIINERQRNLLQDMHEVLVEENINFPIKTTLQIKKGFGGAITSSFYACEPGFSLICLGDYVYRGKTYGDCTRQLVDFWKKNGSSVVGIQSVDWKDAGLYGIVSGQWIADGILKVERIIEKPAASYAKEFFMLDYKGEKNIYAFFGEYILNNELISKMKDHDVIGEMGLSEHLNNYAKENFLYAIVIQGTCFDLGNPKDYYQSFVEYGKDNI